MASDLATLFQFEDHLNDLLETRLAAAGLTVARPRGSTTALPTPRVEASSAAGAALGSYFQGATTGYNYFNAFEAAIRLTIVTPRLAGTQHNTYLGTARQVIAELCDVDATDSPELAIIEVPRQVGTEIEVDDDLDLDLDITELTYATEFRIRDTAWPAGA